jgi:hypothetical protein
MKERRYGIGIDITPRLDHRTATKVALTRIRNGSFFSAVTILTYCDSNGGKNERAEVC